MFSNEDLKQMAEKNISTGMVDSQLAQFINGFPELPIVKAATINNGIKVLKEKSLDKKVKIFESKGRKLKKVKFVPASGAATRMFKDLYEVLNTYDESEEAYLKIKANRSFGSFYYFCQNLNKFAFFLDLCSKADEKGKSMIDISRKKDIKNLLSLFLTENGLNYGNLPKGLLRFHKTETGIRTPAEEHLVEGALYAISKKKVNIHFTVSESHIELFKLHMNEVLHLYEKKYKVRYNISYSLQKSSTDTIAVDLANQPFKTNDGRLVFRPGGHGALIQNLNDIEADLIFIKNIDNVIQDHLKEDTVIYKKALAGLLIELQEEIFYWVKKLNKKRNSKYISQAAEFVEKKLCIILPESFADFTNDEKTTFLLTKLNRPIRICGMVKNEGEPGGGPFWVKNDDGSTSLQIVESSQIAPHKKELMQKATHFNPVDIVCSIIDSNGKKYDLNNYIDVKTGFISQKSFEGRELKALELPGLWNGAMANWNTVFVEVPITTFSPVKTVHDLLKAEHMFPKDMLVDSKSELIFAL